MEISNEISTLYHEIPMLFDIPILSKKIISNTLQSWIIALTVGLLLGLLLNFLRALLARRFRTLARQTKASWDDDFVTVYERTKASFIFLSSYYFSFQGLTFSSGTNHFLDVVFSTTLFLQMILWADKAIFVFVRRQGKIAAKSYSEFRDPKDVILSFVGRFLVGILLILLFLDNLGVNITALITGLGVGGIAIALAVQNILGDLIASISIAMDKPFAVGEAIAVAGLTGTVEKIGLKTTQIRSVNGELIILPNSDLLKQSIQNYKRLSERRVILRLGIVYETPEEKIRAVPSLLKLAIGDTSKTRIERAHFSSFGPSSLDFEAVYWILDSEYNALMDAQQDVNLKVLSLFKKNDIKFAYPTQTIFSYLSKTD
jgi:small-conductance mechanosensitive channel